MDCQPQAHGAERDPVCRVATGDAERQPISQSDRQPSQKMAGTNHPASPQRPPRRAHDALTDRGLLMYFVRSQQ